uniref:Putative head-tail joining protein n=1 Tax=viral metagenome TaxID=1070528 RepID=A0A6M3Y1I7_9ZZZZ
MIGKKVTLELRRKTLVSDGMGGFVEGWAGLRNITGVLSTIRGDERLAADKITVVADYNFYIDFPIGVTITEKDIFVKGTTEYKIIYINNLGNVQDRRLQITLKEEI